MKETPIKHLIGLSGKYQSGKDTVGKILVENHGYQRIAFADAIKNFASNINPYVHHNVRLNTIVEHEGWDNAKTSHPEIRRLLQTIGSEGVRSINPNFWIEAAMPQIMSNHKIVVTDVRFINEYDAIKNLGGHMWIVTRDTTQNRINEHKSETELDQHFIERMFDTQIQNNGTIKQLEKTVNKLVIAHQQHATIHSMSTVSDTK